MKRPSIHNGPVDNTAWFRAITFLILLPICGRVNFDKPFEYVENTFVS